jgi:hypothetical protein
MRKVEAIYKDRQLTAEVAHEHRSSSLASICKFRWRSNLGLFPLTPIKSPIRSCSIKSCLAALRLLIDEGVRFAV